MSGHGLFPPAWRAFHDHVPARSGELFSGEIDVSEVLSRMDHAFKEED